MGDTRYDAVEYPAALYSTTHPDHLAAVARLHGLDSPDPRTARVLEIAGGDGVNVIAMAAALPHARFTSFDLSARAVARGTALVRASGLANVVIETGDLLDLADRMDGPFDYVVVHGLYAWVAEPVREAALRLIGRTLSPDGIAFVSYNALPGGYLRTAVRDMLLHAVQGIDDPDARVAQAHEALVRFATPQPGDRLLQTAMRKIAEPMTHKAPGLLFHDELGDFYAPQALTDVVAAAATHGLAYLGDAIPMLIHDGLPGSDMDDAETVRRAQASDYDSFAFFHQTLLIRPGRTPRRQLDPRVLTRLGATSMARRTGEHTFMLDGEEVEIDDPRLVALVTAAAASAPDPVSLTPFAGTPEDAAAVIRLYAREVLRLHSMPFAGTTTPGERPRTSALALGQIALGLTNLYTLDHRVISFAEDGARAFLTLLDGTRDQEAIAAAWAQTPHAGSIGATEALRQVARAGMLAE